jgi:hypothetical protein
MHYFCLKTAQPAQPAQNIWRWPNCNWARMHAARARCCAGRRPVSAPPRALAARGRGNLGPGRHFARPPRPKGAHSRAERSRSTAARGSRRNKNSYRAVLPETLAHFFFRSPRRLLLSTHASVRRPAAMERAAPRRAPSPARASTAGWARRRRAASPWRPDLRRGEWLHGSSRGPCPREVQDLAGSGRRTGVPSTPTVGGARRTR